MGNPTFAADIWADATRNSTDRRWKRYALENLCIEIRKREPQDVANQLVDRAAFAKSVTGKMAL